MAANDKDETLIAHLVADAVWRAEDMLAHELGRLPLWGREVAERGMRRALQKAFLDSFDKAAEQVPAKRALVAKIKGAFVEHFPAPKRASEMLAQR